jgi:hypothetical protein
MVIPGEYVIFTRCGVLLARNIKTAGFWYVTSVVRQMVTNVSEESAASIYKVEASVRL